MKMKCPYCSAEVEYAEGESEFCSECGNELIASSQNAAQENVSQLMEADMEEGINADCPAETDFSAMLQSLNISGNTKDSWEEWDLSARSREMAENIDSLDFVDTDKSDCSYLKVEYNRNVFFITGSESVIKMRMTPLTDQLQDILVFMEAEHGGENARRQVPCRELFKKGKAFFLKIPFAPENISGRMCLVFYIGCKVNGSFSYYQFSVEHKIYDSRQSGSAISSQITINQEFSSSQAADINYRDSIGEALKSMSDKTMTVNEMIDRLNDRPPEYQVRQLTKTTWRPEDILVKGNMYPTDRLLLEYNGREIYIFNRKSIKFGRDPQQVDLVVRSGRGKLGPREYPNSTVSRKHAEILYCDDTVKLFDYSSYGTYINGKKPDSAGIPLDLNALIEFGDIHWKMTIQKCHARLPHNICQTCQANKIRSVYFSRGDEEPEFYLLIWQCCELGRIIEELTDWTIFARNGCFFIRSPEQQFFHLRPGQEIVCKGKRINIRYLEDY